MKQPATATITVFLINLLIFSPGYPQALAKSGKNPAPLTFAYSNDATIDQLRLLEQELLDYSDRDELGIRKVVAFKTDHAESLKRLKHQLKRRHCRKAIRIINLQLNGIPGKADNNPAMITCENGDTARLLLIPVQQDLEIVEPEFTPEPIYISGGGGIPSNPHGPDPCGDECKAAAGGIGAGVIAVLIWVDFKFNDSGVMNTIGSALEAAWDWLTTSDGDAEEESETDNDDDDDDDSDTE